MPKNTRCSTNWIGVICRYNMRNRREAPSLWLILIVLVFLLNLMPKANADDLEVKTDFNIFSEVVYGNRAPINLNVCGIQFSDIPSETSSTLFIGKISNPQNVSVEPLLEALFAEYDTIVYENPLDSGLSYLRLRQDSISSDLITDQINIGQSDKLESRITHIYMRYKGHVHRFKLREVYLSQIGSQERLFARYVISSHRMNWRFSLRNLDRIDDSLSFFPEGALFQSKRNLSCASPSRIISLDSQDTEIQRIIVEN